MSTDPLQATISQARAIAAQHQIPLVDALHLVRHSELIGSLERISDAIDGVVTSTADIHDVLVKLNRKVI